MCHSGYTQSSVGCLGSATMLPRCGGSGDNRHVTLPCHLAQWPDIKRHLKHMVANNLNCSHKLVSALNDLYVLVHGEDEGVLSHRGVFDGLKKFLHSTTTREETVNFFVVSLPCIVQRAVDIEDLQRDDSLIFSRQQQDGEMCLSRALVASIVACSFLCLFPHRKFKKHSKLCAINFDDFFRHLTSASQCEKLRCILNYFERIALDPGGPSGAITFRRQVVPSDELPSIIDWLTCDQPLCPIQVCHNGRIEDAKSHFIKVNFASPNIGGSVLSTGCLQEEISMCMNPELIAAALFMERMIVNEAIIIHGYETFSQYTGYSTTLQFGGSSFDSAMKDSKGNLENAVCAIDALHLGWYSDTNKQYSDHLVLRELNKAWVGFLQPWCSGEPAHPGSNRESVVTSEEYYSAVEALNDDGAAGNHISPSAEEENGDAHARCPPSSRFANGAAQHSIRKTPATASASWSCDCVDSTARSSLVAVSETSEPCTTHVTSDTSDATKTPSTINSLNRTSPMNFDRVLPTDGMNSDVGVQLCGSSPRSEFSSEFEEYFESMQHQSQSLVVLEEHKTSQKQCAPVVQSFVGILVTQSFQDGCQAAVDMLPKVETFSCCQPNNLVKPKAVRPSGCDLSLRCCQGEDLGINRGAHCEFVLRGDERVDVADTRGDADVCARCTSQASVNEFASSLLRNTYDSAVLNMQGRLESQVREKAPPVEDMVDDDALQEAFTAHVGQQRRRTVSEGVTDGHADTTVLCDSAVPSFYEECLSDEMKVKLMEMVANQQAQADMQRVSSTGSARRASGSGGIQTTSGGGITRRASGYIGTQRTSRDAADGGTTSSGGQTVNHWNVPAIRIYSEDADLTEPLNLQGSGLMTVSDELCETGRRSSVEDGHNQRCSCPHCVCSVDGYVDVMIDDVLTETYDAIMENQCDEAKEQFARCTFRSLDGAAEPDLHRFAGRLVHLAMRDAMRLLRRANKHGKRCRHQSQGRASSPRVEVTSEHANSRYFEQEFSHDMKHLSPRKSSLVPSSVPSNIDIRRCSLDETRSLQLSNQCSSFRDAVLSDFEDELRNSMVRSPNLHLFESDDGCLPLHRTQRRASEPIHTLKRDSITESTSCVVPAVDVTCQSTTATSTEVVLGWLNATNWGGHGDREQRPTTPVSSASPLNLYVEEMIAQVFSSTYMELFHRDLRPAVVPPEKLAVDEPKAVCDATLFTRLWHGPRAVHCSPPGGIGSNSNMKLLMSSYFPTPAPFHSLNVMAAVMSGHIVRDAVRAVSNQQRREEPKFLRPIATGNWGCGDFRGDPQLKALLQWAAASRVQVPTLSYYSFSNPHMLQFASVCRQIERRGLTVGELLKLVVDYCHRREDSYHDPERTLFDDICRINNG